MQSDPFAKKKEISHAHTRRHAGVGMPEKVPATHILNGVRKGHSVRSSVNGGVVQPLRIEGVSGLCS